MKMLNGNVFLSVWFLVFMAEAGLSVRQFRHAALLDQLSQCTSQVDGQNLDGVHLTALEGCVRSLYGGFVGQPEEALLLNWFMDVRQESLQSPAKTLEELRQISSGFRKQQWAGELLFLSLPWACLAYVLSFVLKPIHAALGIRNPRHPRALPQRILVIEDDEVFAKAFTVALENRGYQVDIAKTLAVASHLIQTSQYDCVFCDYYLKNEMGTDFYKGHKALLNKGRFVVMSGEDETVVLSKGQYKFLQKPFAYAQVRSLIPAG